MHRIYLPTGDTLFSSWGNARLHGRCNNVSYSIVSFTSCETRTNKSKQTPTVVVVVVRILPSFLLLLLVSGAESEQSASDPLPRHSIYQPANETKLAVAFAVRPPPSFPAFPKWCLHWTFKFKSSSRYDSPPQSPFKSHPLNIWASGWHHPTVEDHVIAYGRQPCTNDDIIVIKLGCTITWFFIHFIWLCCKQFMICFI